MTMYQILIIDDEPYARQVVRSLGKWKELGIEIVGEASDGKEGIRKLAELHPQIVITDMRMPGLDGSELLKKFETEDSKVKIIVMSGYNDFSYLQQAIRSSAVDYLMKPVDPVELNSCLQRCVQELKREESKGRADISVPLNMFKKEQREIYTSLCERLRNCLLELDASSVRGILNQIHELISTILLHDQAGQVLSCVAYELLLPLKDFYLKNGEEGQWFSDYPISELAVVHMDSPERVFCELSDIYERFIATIENVRHNKYRLNLKEVQNYIDEHFCEKISLSNIAQNFFVSKEYLSRAFKAFAGENISDYISRKRMEKARDLIVQQKISIRYAAEAVGYQDIAYFYRIYKKHFGVTPGKKSILSNKNG